MKRLIKKAELPKVDLSSTSVTITSENQLDENFAYRVEQAYAYIDICGDICDILKSKSKQESINDKDKGFLEECLQSLQALDANTFKNIQSSIDKLQIYLDLTDKQNQLWDKMQALQSDAKKFNKGDSKLDAIYQQMTEIHQEMTNKDTEQEISNAKSYFKYMFQKTSRDTFANIYNSQGIYYTTRYDEKSAYSTNIATFADFCENISNESKEVTIPRKRYIKDYLLPDILGDNYQTYIDGVDNYLHSSNYEYLNTIAEMTLNNPDLIQLNLIVSESPSEVYRGLSFNTPDDIDYQDILSGNINTSGRSRFASTSTVKSVAVNFANAKKDGGGVGLLLTIQPGTIIYSSNLIDGVFGENEVIIDMQSSTITNTEQI